MRLHPFGLVEIVAVPAMLATAFPASAQPEICNPMVPLSDEWREAERTLERSFIERGDIDGARHVRAFVWQRAHAAPLPEGWQRAEAVLIQAYLERGDIEGAQRVRGRLLEQMRDAGLPAPTCPPARPCAPMINVTSGMPARTLGALVRLLFAVGGVRTRRSAVLAFDVRGGGDAAAGLVAWTNDDQVLVAPVPLHAIARRFQRGWDVSDAAIRAPPVRRDTRSRPCVRCRLQSFGNDAAATFRAWRYSFSVPTGTGGSLLSPATGQGPGYRRTSARGTG
jgi:hypothetical protein